MQLDRSLLRCSTYRIRGSNSTQLWGGTVSLRLSAVYRPILVSSVHLGRQFISCFISVFSNFAFRISTLGFVGLRLINFQIAYGFWAFWFADFLIFGFLLLCSVISVAKLFVIIVPIVFSSPFPLALFFCLLLSFSVCAFGSCSCSSANCDWPEFNDWLTAPRPQRTS